MLLWMAEITTGAVPSQQLKSTVCLSVLEAENDFEKAMDHKELINLSARLGW